MGKEQELDMVTKVIKTLIKKIAQQFCDHDWQGWAFNGSGGAKVYCEKCGFTHYGRVNDLTWKKAIRRIKQREKKQGAVS